MNKAVFLDRDGTINHDSGYVHKTEDLVFIKGSIEAIKKLNENNFLVIVITNQAGVAKGYYSENEVKKFHDKINNELQKHNAHIDQFYYCPHHPDGLGEYKTSCQCRKPHSDLIEKAIKEYNIDRKKSFMIGDKDSDILTGENAKLCNNYKINDRFNLLYFVVKIIAEQ